MGRPPSKFVTDPRHANDPTRRRQDYLTRAELIYIEQSWLHENPGDGKEAFYRSYAESYLGLPSDKIGHPELETVRQLFRDAKVRARKAGWLNE